MTLDAPVLIAATFLNGVKRSIKTIPMLNICTPPPDMYNMNACIGNDFAGDMAKSHARLSFSLAYEFFVDAALDALEGSFD